MRFCRNCVRKERFALARLERGRDKTNEQDRKLHSLLLSIDQNKLFLFTRIKD
jgi:hypothetical protein